MLKVHVSSLGAAEHYEHRPITGSACEIEWHFPALVELYRHDAPGRRPGSGSSQPGPANTDGSRATRRLPLSGASGLVSVGPTVPAEPAMRFCRLRAMQQPELLLTNHASSSGRFGAGSATRGPDMRKARGGAGEGEGRATSTGKVEKWVVCRAR